MGRLWGLIQAHMDSQTYRVSERQVSRALGVSPTAIRRWKDPSELPSRENLQSIARLAGVSYRTALTAALFDIGYLDEEAGEGHVSPAATTGARDDTGLLGESEDQRLARYAAALRAAGHTERAVADALRDLPAPDRPSGEHRAGEVPGSTGHNTAGHAVSDSAHTSAS